MIIIKIRNNWTIKLFLSSNDLQTLVCLLRCTDRSALFIMHINVKMPTVIGILTFISTIKNSFIISGLACKWFAQVYMTQVSGQYVLYLPFVLIVSTKFRECMLFWCASFLTRELRYCDGAFCTQKFKYICYTEAFEDDSVSTFNYSVSEKTFTQAGENFPCTGDIQLTSRSEGRCTYLVSSLQMTLEILFVCLILFFTSTQQSFSYAGRFFLGLTSTKLG